jgi:hypothetical protein
MGGKKLSSACRGVMLVHSVSRLEAAPLVQLVSECATFY